MQGNKIEIGSGAYSISTASSATSITLVNQATPTATSNVTYSTSMSAKNGNLVPRNQYTSPMCYNNDFSILRNGYVRHNNEWYRLPSTPVKSLGNPVFVDGSESTLVLLGAGQESAVITYCDSLSISQGVIVENNRQTQTVTSSSSFDFLKGKILIKDNAYYKIAANENVVSETVMLTERIPYRPSGGTHVQMWDFFLVGSTITYNKNVVTWGAKDAHGIRIGSYVMDQTYTVSSLDDTYNFFNNKGYVIQTNGTGTDAGYRFCESCRIDRDNTMSPSSWSFTVYGEPYYYNDPSCKPPTGADAIMIDGTLQVMSASSYIVTATGHKASTSSAPKFEFYNDKIDSITGEKCVNLSGDELSIDTLTVEVEHEVSPRMLFRSSDGYVMRASGHEILTGSYTENLRDLEYGSPIQFYHDDRLMGQYYNKTVERIAREKFRINAVSLMGLLDMQYHKGGVYVNQTFQNILGEILGNMSVTVEPSVASTRVTGWLPYDTCRNNLHQLLFATNAVFLRADDGSMVFTYLLTSEAQDEIPDGRIYENGEVEYSTPCSRLELTEHAYEAIETVDRVTVFDNTESSAVTSKKVVFDNAPVIYSTIQTTGTITISEGNCNYAIVTGQGTITAIPYTHVTYSVIKENSAATTERVVTCTDATLVSTLNSDNVSNRLLSYYKSARTIKNGIKIDGERCGSRYNLKDSFGDSANAYLSKISYRISSIIKGDCEFIADYVPSSVGNNYSAAILLTKADEATMNGKWVSPKTGTIHVTLIGGGNGGASGYAGADSARDSFYTTDNSDGGEGGQGGTHGNGGYIYSIDMSVVQGTEYTFHIGTGSNGGAQCSSHTTNNQATDAAVHAAGDGKTTFAGYSSATGGSVSTGVMNLFNGAVYALPGKDGVEGAAGGAGGYRFTAQETWDGHDGENVTYGGNTYYGGSGGMGQSASAMATGSQLFGGDMVGGTGGGGAAVGANGENGYSGEGYTEVKKSWGKGDSIDYICNYGKNGNGADAASGDDAVIVGAGGSAGHGGGGEGGYSGCNTSPVFEEDNGEYQFVVGLIAYPAFTEGRGGYGGKGGKGADGGILIYI